MGTLAYEKEKEQKKLDKKLAKIQEQRKETNRRKINSVRERKNNTIEQFIINTTKRSLKKYNKRANATLKKKKHKELNLKREYKGKAQKEYDEESFSNIKKKAQRRFQYFIRLRDTNDNWYWNCISTWERRHYRGADWWHIRPKKNYPHLQFDEDNCHLQSKGQNYLQLDTVANEETMINVKEKIWSRKYNALRKRAKDDELKRKARARDRAYYRKMEAKYKKKSLILEQKKYDNRRSSRDNKKKDKRI